MSEPVARNLAPNPKPLDQGLSYNQVKTHEILDGWLRATGNDADTGWIMKCWQGIDLDTNGTTGYQNGVRLAAPGDYVVEISVHTPAQVRLQLVLILVSDSGGAYRQPNRCYLGCERDPYDACGCHSAATVLVDMGAARERTHGQCTRMEVATHDNRLETRL